MPPTSPSPSPVPSPATATTLLIGTTTVSARSDADRLARALIGTRLAACVQIDGPITSIYHWQDKLETTGEFRLTIKFPAANAAALDTWLHANHPYDTPEWVVVRAEIVAEKYLSWARSNSTFSPL
jgi:periplasmic divalent cation tolerance protein